MDEAYIAITHCVPLSDYRLFLRFSDGTAGQASVKHLVGKGVFTAWESEEFFKSVKVSEELQTVVWDECLDLDPVVLYRQVKERTWCPRRSR
jgi:hypothetical protein